MNIEHRTFQLRAKAVTLGIDEIISLTRIWGSAHLGLQLSDAYFQGKPLSSDRLAQIIDVSPETVRRWLRPLVNIGRVRVIKSGRNVCYKANAEWAQRTADIVLDLYDRLSNSPQI